MIIAAAVYERVRFPLSWRGQEPGEASVAMPGLSHPGWEERNVCVCVCVIKQSIMLSASLKSCVIFLFPDSWLRFLWHGCSRRPNRSDATLVPASSHLHPRAPAHPCRTSQGDVLAVHLLCSPLITQGKVGALSPCLLGSPCHLCTGPMAAVLQRFPGATCHGRELCANKNYSV